MVNLNYYLIKEYNKLSKNHKAVQIYNMFITTNKK